MPEDQVAAQEPEDPKEEGEAEPKTMLINPDESVYSFAIFVPCIEKARSDKTRAPGSDMKLGCMLLFINFLMQIGLTFVVAQGVLKTGSAWRQELVRVDVDDQVDILPKQVSFLSEHSMMPGASWMDSADAEETLAMDLHPLDQSRVNQALVQEGRGRLAKGGLRAVPSHGMVPAGAAVGAKSLCSLSKKNATYSCLPPSVRFSQYWPLLDTNGDGIWTKEEAEVDAGKLFKKINVKPFFLMRAIIMGLIDRKDEALWIPDATRELKELPKAYFDYWMGDASLCAHADVGRCGALVANGIFNKAMDPANHGKGINDLDSAMDYCTFMLKDGGGCDQSLPQVYKLYKARRRGQCGDMYFYAAGIFKNPHKEKDKMYVIGSGYDALGGYEKSEGNDFKFFLFLVLLLWLMALSSELKEVMKLAEFCLVYPDEKDCEGGVGAKEIEEDGETKFVIEGISSGHRSMLGVTCLLRGLLIIYVGAVGCVFLVNDTGYMDLLMNAVALAFIIEIDEFLFGALARLSVQDELECTENIEFESRLPTEGCAGWMLQKDFWGLVLFPIIALVIIVVHSHFTVAAVLDALNCACYQEGEACQDAKYYTADFWDNYWSNTLPSALSAIKKLKEAAGK